MTIFLRNAMWVACFLITASIAQAQSVAMSGEYGESSGRTVNLPLNPPQVPCTNVQNARCPQGSRKLFGSPQPDPLAEPSQGVGVSGAGVVVMPGGLSIGDRFTVPPEVFRQKANGVPNATPIVNNSALVQLNTTIDAVMPALARAVSPPANTRVFEADAWSQPGNGMTGRVAASTTPISFLTQTVHNITVRYTAGPNAFGGTMADLLDREGVLYLTGPAVGSPGNAMTGPWIGSVPIGDAVAGNPQTANGAGWGYTRMGARASGLVRSRGGISAPCTSTSPPTPVGCGLVTKIEGDIVAVIPSATSTQFIYAYTTGTVYLQQANTQGGFTLFSTLTAMGYDTVLGTGSSAVRNIGLVAGGFTRRTIDGEAPFDRIQIVGLDIQFTPEPASTFGLLTGLAGLAGLARRRVAFSMDR